MDGWMNGWENERWERLEKREKETREVWLVGGPSSCIRD